MNKVSAKSVIRRFLRLTGRIHWTPQSIFLLPLRCEGKPIAEEYWTELDSTTPLRIRVRTSGDAQFRSKHRCQAWAHRRARRRRTLPGDESHTYRHCKKCKAHLA